MQIANADVSLGRLTILIANHASLTVTVGRKLPVLETLQSHPLHWQFLSLTLVVVGIFLGQGSGQAKVTDLYVLVFPHQHIPTYTVVHCHGNKFIYAHSVTQCTDLAARSLCMKNLEARYSIPAAICTKGTNRKL